MPTNKKIMISPSRFLALMRANPIIQLSGLVTVMTENAVFWREIAPDNIAIKSQSTSSIRTIHMIDYEESEVAAFTTALTRAPISDNYSGSEFFRLEIYATMISFESAQCVPALPIFDSIVQ